MNDEAEFQCNKLLKLDNTMLMYGIYNAETLEKLINTVQELHNVTSSHEKLFAGDHNPALFKNYVYEHLRYTTICIQFTSLFENRTR